MSQNTHIQVDNRGHRQVSLAGSVAGIYERNAQNRRNIEAEHVEKVMQTHQSRTA